MANAHAGWYHALVPKRDWHATASPEAPGRIMAHDAAPPTIDELVDALDLRAHPEGGFYARSFKSAGETPIGVLPRAFAREPLARPWSTAIYYLLPAGGISRMHRIAADELWHFYLGGPLVVAEVEPASTGTVRETTLGHDLFAGQCLQHAVPGGRWFGAWSAANESDDAPYSLVGCTVAPGFDFADFEMCDRDALLAEYPDASAIIERLT